MKSTEYVLALVLHNLVVLFLRPSWLFVFDLNGLRVGMVGLLLFLRPEETLHVVVVVLAQLLLLLDLSFALLHVAEL